MEDAESTVLCDKGFLKYLKPIRLPKGLDNAPRLLEIKRLRRGKWRDTGILQLHVCCFCISRGYNGQALRLACNENLNHALYMVHGWLENLVRNL
jgi:hypothetical protein